MDAILRGFLLVIEVLSAFLLIVIILMQKSKSQGMGLAFGGAMGESLFGARMGNVLTKATVILGIIFLVNTTLLAMIGPGGEARKSLSEELAEETVPAQMPQQMPVLPQEPATPLGETPPAAPPADTVVPPAE